MTDFRLEANRVSSFKSDWSGPSPVEMAAVGFYHAPLPEQADRVVCSGCGKSIRDSWCRSDSPASEHRKLGDLQCCVSSQLSETVREKLEDLWRNNNWSVSEVNRVLGENTTAPSDSTPLLGRSSWDRWRVIALLIAVALGIGT